MKKKLDIAEENEDEDEDDMFLYGNDEEDDADGDGAGATSSNDNAADSVPAAESEAMTLEKELALEGNEGLGDDGRVRFYVAVCPAHGTSLHILAIPSLEPVFQYNFESHPLERVGLTSRS